MKKILFSVILTMSLAIADDIKGFIESINRIDKTIVVNKTLIQVQPYTKIEKDTCWGLDISSKFSNLKVADLVDVDVMMYQDILVAEEIEIKCRENTAY